MNLTDSFNWNAIPRGIRKRKSIWENTQIEIEIEIEKNKKEEIRHSL